MKSTYKTKGVCADQIDLDIQDGVIKDVVFHKGCNGNLGGISSLVKGILASEAAEKLRGIKCGTKSTSCPDQLANALDNLASSN